MRFRKSIGSLIFLFYFILLSSGQDTVLLFHPTAYNIEVFQKLSDEGLFSLSGYHLLGVYHQKENYDYSESQAYLDEHHIADISLRKINGMLDPGNIFHENSATEEFRKLFLGSKGALFMGGPDIPPVVYGEQVHLLTSVTDPYRHYLELSYIFHLLGGSQDPEWKPYLEENKSYLVNGICLGMQTLNVATGGTLVQDIPTEIYGIWKAEEILALPPDQMHRNYLDYLSNGCENPTSYHFHRIKLGKGMILTEGLGFKSRKGPLVLSSHHQAVGQLGAGWEVAATSMDGKIIEALQHKRYPNVLGVQFHPEKPGLFDPSVKQPAGCGSSINFQETIENSESYLFHTLFWKYLDNQLQKNREIR
jgi:putative glutamine amidotransferase